MENIKKYLMLNENDYRPNIDTHEVSYIKQLENGEVWAYGVFSEIDEDMVDITEEEYISVPKNKIPNISLRQCRELLIRKGLLSKVNNFIDSIKDETEKNVMKNFMEYSNEIERNHPLISGIAKVIELDKDRDIDLFFVEASKL